jgi:hypothetical protein
MHLSQALPNTEPPELVEPILPPWTLCGGLVAPYCISGEAVSSADQPVMPTSEPLKFLSDAYKPRHQEVCWTLRLRQRELLTENFHKGLLALGIQHLSLSPSCSASE